MCHIKTNEKIENTQDVQNLITAVILRQRGRFTRRYLLKAVRHYLTRSKVENIRDNLIIEMIDDSLEVFGRYEKVKYSEGKYHLSSKYMVG